MKQMKKIISIMMIAILSVGLFGCAASKLPDGFNEDEVGTAAQEIVGLATEGDYDSIVAALRADLKSSVTADQLKEGWAATYEKAGEFEKISKIVFSGTKDKTTGEEYAVAQVVVKHADANLLYTLSFDKDLALVGLYLK